MGKKKTHDEFVNDVNELTGDQYKVLSSYINTNTKIILEHKKCGYMWRVPPRSFLRGARCPNCNGKPIKDTQYFKNEIKLLSGDEYELLSEYKNTSTHVNLKHRNCGEIWRVQPRSFLRGSRCPNCFRKEKALSIEEFQDRIAKNNYLLMSEYKNINHKVIVKHLPCGQIEAKSPQSLLKLKECLTCKKQNTKERNRQKLLQSIKKLGDGYIVVNISEIEEVTLRHACGHEYNLKSLTIIKNGGECPKCFQRDYWDEKKFRKELYSLVGDEYQLITPFINMTSKVILFHKECGNQYTVTPTKFISPSSSTRCIHCARKRISEAKRISQKEFLERLDNVWGSEFEMLCEYNGTENPIRVKHKCGHIYSPKPSHLLNGHGCPRCSGHYKDTDIFRNEVDNLTENEYEVLSEYKNSNEEVLMKHIKCGKSFFTKPTSFLANKKRCPYCRETIGETKIRHILERKDIKFIQQYTFDDCRNKRPLRFDFAVFDENNLICVIEFDGLQHDKKIDYFGGEVGFEYTKKNDEIKNKYCIKNKIPLFRITYDQLNNLDNLLNNILSYCEVIDDDIENNVDLVYKYLVI